MAQKDLQITMSVPLDVLLKGMQEAVSIARTHGKLMADALRAALADSLNVPFTPPPFKPPPSDPTGGKKKPPPDQDPAEIQRKADEAGIAVEQRQARIREALSEKTTDELLSDVVRLRTARDQAAIAEREATDKTVKAELATRRKAAQEELQIATRTARERTGDSGILSGITSAAGGAITSTLAPLAGIAGIGAAFTAIVGKGSEFDAGVKELQAITGVAGADLEKMAGSARSLALEFGGSATANIESFKGVLSKLGPQLPADQLDKVTRSINTLSAASGDDAVASMDAITASILQFQVPLDGTVDVGNEAARMMNVLAAGAKFGAAEVPQVADAIKVAGVAASGAKVSFEETNASIQALAAGGKVGAEAGTALRNVLGKLGEGRFLPKDVKKEFEAAGVDINKLGDTSLSLTDRLRELAKVQGDTALISKLFGSENAAAGSILLRSVDDIDSLTASLTGTQTAYEQAQINQSSFAAGFDRFKAQMSDLAIGAFEALGPALSTGLSAAGSAIAFLVDGFKAMFGFVSDNSTAFGILAGVLAVYAIVANAGAVATYIMGAAATETTAATGLAAVKQWLWNAALTANPIGLVIAGVAALLAGLILLNNAMSESAEEALEAAKAEGELNKQQKEVTAGQITRLKAIGDLAKRYEELGKSTKRTAKEEQELGNIQIELNRQYPGLIDNTKSFSQNLDAVQAQAKKAADGITNLNAEMRRLDLQSVAINAKIAEREAQQIEKEIQDAVLSSKGILAVLNTGAAEILNTISLGLFSASTNESIDASKFVHKFAQGIKAAKTDGELNKALLEFRQGVLDKADIGEADKTAIDALVIKLANFRRAQLDAKKTPAEAVVPTTTTTDTGDGKKDEVKEALSFAAKITEAKNKAADILGAVDLANAKDERARLSIAADLKRKQIARDLLKDTTDAETEAKKAAADGRKVEGLDTFKVERKKQADAELLQLTTETNDKLRALSQKLLDDELKASSAAAQLQRDQAQAALDLEVAQQDALGIVTADGLRKRLKLQQDVRSSERALFIANLVSQDAEFKRQFEALQADFDAGAIDESALRDRLAGLRTTFTATAEVDVRTKSFDATTIKDDAEAEKQIRIQSRQELIDELATLAERERAEALAEIDDRLADELLRFATNEKAKTEALQRAAAERAAIEEKHLSETDQLYSLSKDFKAALESAFTNDVSNEARKQAEVRAGELDKSKQDLVALAVRGEISQKEFLTQSGKIATEQAKIQETLGRKTFDFDRDIKAAGIKATEAFEKDRTKAFAKSEEAILKLSSEHIALRNSLEGASAEERIKIEEAIVANEATLNAKRGEAIADFTALAAGSFLTAIAAGEDAGKAFVRITFDMVQQAIPSLVALIFAQSFALNPIVGGVLAGVATAAVYGLLALARSAVGFKRGGYTGDGDPNEIAGPAHKREYYFPEDITRQRRPLFDHILAGGDPAAFLRVPSVEHIELRPDMSGVVVRQGGVTIEQVTNLIATSNAPMVAELLELKRHSKRTADTVHKTHGLLDNRIPTDGPATPSKSSSIGRR